MGCAKTVQTTLYILRRNGKRKVVFQYLKKIGNAYVDYNGEQHAQILGENITPVQQRTQIPSTACWRACGANEANHFHVFWDCPVLTSYWQEIHSHLEATFKVIIPCRFDTLYIGNISFDSWDYRDKKLLLILLVASKKAISRRWLKQDSPTIGEWLDVVHDIYKMEKLSYSLKIQTVTFSRIWSKWTGYVEHIGLRSDFV